jgi:MraZ protein
MAVPAKHRERLHVLCEGKLIVTIDPLSKCLSIYPLPEWEAIEEKFRSISTLNRATQSYKRLLLGNATEIDLDANGRFLLPPNLRSYAQLEKKAALVGQGAKLELWSEEGWDAAQAAALEDIAAGDLELPADLMDISF